jgi:hypothetical protein
MQDGHDAGEPPACWICLGGEGGEGGEGGALEQLCHCPRQVHQECLASWQLFRAGTRCAAQRRRAAGGGLRMARHSCLLPADTHTHTARYARSEETCCRFCHANLPDWRGVLAPPQLAGQELGHIRPLVSIHYRRALLTLPSCWAGLARSASRHLAWRAAAALPLCTAPRPACCCLLLPAGA